MLAERIKKVSKDYSAMYNVYMYVGALTFMVHVHVPGCHTEEGPWDVPPQNLDKLCHNCLKRRENCNGFAHK